MDEDNYAPTYLRCTGLDSQTVTVTIDTSFIQPPDGEITVTVVDGDPGDIYITINAGEGSLAPFTDLAPFYQDRVRNTVERILQETDGVSIRQWALESDFLHTSLETMDLNELVEILTHVAIVGR